MARLPSQKAAANEATKALHSQRRAAGLCMYDARDRGRPPHGVPFRGGRCEACWLAKRESETRAKGGVDPIDTKIARLEKRLEELKEQRAKGGARG